MPGTQGIPGAPVQAVTLAARLPGWYQIRYHLLLMAKWAKLLAAMQNNPRGVRFDDLCQLVCRLGYELVRTKGSHHIYRSEGLPMLNLQETSGGMAKPYQVQQVLNVIEQFALEV